MSRHNSAAANTTNKSSALAAASKSKASSMPRKSSLARTSSKELDMPPAGIDKTKTPLTALLSRNQQVKTDANLTLITVTVLGSPGPLRFLVDKHDKVSRVLELSLKVYAREGRLPTLNSKSVELYCNNGDFKVLNPNECVGDLGTRQFMLYRKKPEESSSEYPSSSNNASAGPFKHWWNLVSSIVCTH